MKLLIGEDNSGVRHVIRSLLATVANEICECADGAETLAAYSANGPNFAGFVLVDIDMKTMDGNYRHAAHHGRGSIALRIVSSDFIVSSAKLFHSIKRIKLCRRITFVRLFSVLALAFVASASSAATFTYEVGTCMPGLPSYPTISAALGATPSADVVKVCPGTYNEQVVITQPVTLEGVPSGDSAQAIIAVPSGGLVANTFFSSGPIAAQLLVDNASGLVNVSDLTVDGTGNGVVEPTVAGIVYQNSSGTVNRVATRNQSGNGSGVGILALGGSSNPSVTIENASVHDFDFTGIETGTNSLLPLSVAIKGNEVTTTAVNSGGVVIFGGTVTVTSNLILNLGLDGVGVLLETAKGGTISRNTVMNATVGISTAVFSVGTISDNTVMNSGTIGIDAEADGVSVTSNKIFGSPTGIRLMTSVAAVQNNTITKSPIGIDFQCNADPNVFSNIITDAGTGLNSVPSAIGPRDTYFNVGTIRAGGC